MAANLLVAREQKQTAAELLNLEHEDMFSGYPTNDWLEDLKTRASMLNIEKQKQEVEELDKRINKLVSPDQRREMELLELQKLLEE